MPDLFASDNNTFFFILFYFISREREILFRERERDVSLCVISIGPIRRFECHWLLISPFYLLFGLKLAAVEYSDLRCSFNPYLHATAFEFSFLQSL
jgi:hypothetical protein